MATLRLVLGIVAAALAFGAQAQTNAFVPKYTGTLKKINDSGVLRLGYRENSPPFAFLDPKGKPVGYSLDLCEIVVDEIVAELGKDIRVEYRPGHAGKPVRPRQLRRSGPRVRLDDEQRRAAQGRGVLAHDVRDRHQAAGARGAAGSARSATCRARPSWSRAARCTRRRSRSSPSGGSSRSSSSSAPTTTSRSSCSQPERPTRSPTTTSSSTACSPRRRPAAQYRVVGDFLTYADYALMLRKDDPEFAELVERAFGRLAGSREIVAIYDKWFQQAAALGREAGPADEPAPRGGVPGAGAAATTEARSAPRSRRLPRFEDKGDSSHGNPERPRSG